ncbi:MAG: DUF4878 domain-containing protein [Lentisphaerae bacterium]|nr:DUF4878 domain-containing protein [Lentisphaerota bacterium]
MSDQVVTSSLISRISNRCGTFSFFAQILLLGAGAIGSSGALGFHHLLLYAFCIYGVSSIAGLLALTAIVCGIMALLSMTPAEKQVKLFTKNSTKNMAVTGIILPLVLPILCIIIGLLWGSQFKSADKQSYESSQYDYSVSDYSEPELDAHQADKQPSIPPTRVVQAMLNAMEYGDVDALFLYQKENEKSRQTKALLDAGGDEAKAEFANEMMTMMQAVTVEVLEEKINGDNAEVKVIMKSKNTDDSKIITVHLVKENNFWYITE